MTAQQFEEGARVRVSRALTTDELKWAGRLWPGKEFRVDEVLLAADDPDPQPDHIAVDYIEGTDDTGSNVSAPCDAVELVMSAAQAEARRPPTATEIRNEIQSSLLNDYDDFRVDETDRDGERSVECYGRTAAGLAFGFVVTVNNVHEVDL